MTVFFFFFENSGFFQQYFHHYLPYKSNKTRENNFLQNCFHYCLPWETKTLGISIFFNFIFIFIFLITKQSLRVPQEVSTPAPKEITPFQCRVIIHQESLYVNFQLITMHVSKNSKSSKLMKFTPFIDKPKQKNHTSHNFFMKTTQSINAMSVKYLALLSHLHQVACFVIVQVVSPAQVMNSSEVINIKLNRVCSLNGTYQKKKTQKKCTIFFLNTSYRKTDHPF